MKSDIAKRFQIDLDVTVACDTSHEWLKVEKVTLSTYCCQYSSV